MVDSVNEYASAATLLREVGRLHVRAQREIAACSDGRSVAQCQILGELAHGGSMQLTELARRLGADKGWTSRAVASLARERLVARSRVKRDGRAVGLALTRAGAARWRRIDGALERQALRVVEAVPAGELATVRRALALLREALAANAARARPVTCSRGEPRVRRVP